MNDPRFSVTVVPWLVLGLILLQLWVAGALILGEGATAAGAAILGALAAHWADSVRDARRERREDALRFLDVRRELYARFNMLCRELLLATWEDPHDVESRDPKAWEAGAIVHQIELIAPDNVLDQLALSWGAVREFAMGREVSSDQFQAAHDKLRALERTMRADVRPSERGKADGT